MSLPLEQADEWMDFLTGDTSRERLLSLLRALRCDGSELARIRAAHVLIMLGRPSWAAKLLADQLTPLARAQRALALVRLSQMRDEPHLLTEIISQPAQLGVARSALDREAQIRSYLAHGMAHAILRDAESAGRNLTLAIEVARMEGLHHLERNAQMSAVTSLGTPQDMEALRQFALAQRGTPYQEILRHSADRLRSYLLETGRVLELIEFSEALQNDLPDASWWRQAAQSLEYGTPPPDASVAASDELMITAHNAYYQLKGQRARERLDVQEQNSCGRQAMQLVGRLASQKMVERVVVLRLGALLNLGDVQTATKLLGDFPHESVLPSVRLLAAFGAVMVLVEGGTYSTNFAPRQIVRSFTESLPHFEPQAIKYMVHMLCRAHASAALVTAKLLGGVFAEPFQLGQVAVLTDCSAQDLGLGDGVHIIHYPRGEYGDELRSAYLARRGEVRMDRLRLHRWRKILDSVNLPLAVDVQAERALRHLTPFMSPRS